MARSNSDTEATTLLLALLIPAGLLAVLLIYLWFRIMNVHRIRAIIKSNDLESGSTSPSHIPQGSSIPGVVGSRRSRRRDQMRQILTRPAAVYIPSLPSMLSGRRGGGSSVSGSTRTMTTSTTATTSVSRSSNTSTTRTGASNGTSEWRTTGSSAGSSSSGSSGSSGSSSRSSGKSSQKASVPLEMEREMADAGID